MYCLFLWLQLNVGLMYITTKGPEYLNNLGLNFYLLMECI